MKKRKSPEPKGNNKKKQNKRQEQHSKPLHQRIERDVILFTILSVVLFIIIRSIYPIPDYIPDSKGYLLGSLKLADIGYRPMGISLFLSKMHKLNPSLVFVAWVQYALYLFSGLLIVHAFFSIYTFKPVARKILLGIALLNLPMLQLANMISSDSLFISLTIIWIALCILLIRKPGYLLLPALLLVLWMSAFVRYNALIYPVVTVVALLFVRNRLIMITGSVLCIVLVWSFYNNITHKMVLATGTKVLSGFSGWQLASNAMMAYKAIDDKGLNSDDKMLNELDKNVVKYIDSAKAADKNYAHSFSLDFMWSQDAPFAKAQHKYAVYSREGQFVCWTKTSVVLQQYGRAIIEKYPVAFAKYYLFPNLVNFFYPELEFLEKYTAPEIQLWGEITQAYNTPEWAKNNHTTLPATYNTPFRLLYLVISLVFVVLFLRFLFMFRKWDLDREVRLALSFIGIYLFCKLGFEVFAAPITLRYVLMTMPILAGAILIMLSAGKKADKAEKAAL